ncbi:MAG TPA: polyribonucleotide nucleotidyltransferase [candidate division WOR-3 bacterium]|uniref:Polyribonucleotide nucleotidyltransferase n=1 Tax=candidate division WOR-3 bacterium TaxID=2052148 RepID=A0A9C9JZC4_UNCW3|nr:polyribonucleotide nucleotidyltransferase [candidate division WOR-3 bacterium]
MYSAELILGEKKLRIETGRVAKQSAGECVVSYGDTVLLVCVNYNKDINESIDFLPLTVDYRELSFAAGKIPGGFIKREGRPSENEILTSRLIDRPLRTLFPDDFRNEVQVIAHLLSSDVEHEADTLGIIGAATALLISELNFNTPLAAVKVGLKDGQYIINPGVSEQECCKLSLVVAGTKDSVVMIEGGAQEVSEEDVVGAIKFAVPEILRIIKLEEEIRENVGKEKLDFSNPFMTKELFDKIREALGDNLEQVYRFKEKKARELAKYELIKAASEKLKDEDEDIEKKVRRVVDELLRKKMRHQVLREKKRIDGRSPDEIRPISCEIGVLPRTHGSAIFTRGQTQSLAVTTLGTASDEQRIDAIYGEESKSFMLHYNFPPFATGEVRPMRGPGRREIGHGALAERAIVPVLPSEESFPYTIRVVSNILESNGSSSMATVCGSSLSLMDAGVPIKTAVAGISIGLIKEGNEYVLLTDIVGDEDHYGDMDFKVAGTANGITAIQLDLKIAGLDMEILTKGLTRAKDARMKILQMMNSTISAPRKEISQYAPKNIVFSIPKDKIGEVIGPGGKIIRKIIADLDVTIDIEDDGKVTISGTNAHNVDQAQEKIRSLVQEVEVGKTYIGKVKRITNFGAFVEILPGKEGLVHISKLSRQRVRKVEDVVKVGDEIIVKVHQIDDQGRINLIRRE